MDPTDISKAVTTVEAVIQDIQQAPDAGVGAHKVQPAVQPPVPDVTTNDSVEAPIEVQKSWLWITDDHGKGNVPVTLLFVAFWASTIAYVVSIFEHIGPFTMRPFDATACAAYLGSIIALYLGHKGVDAWSKK